MIRKSVYTVSRGSLYSCNFSNLNICVTYKLYIYFKDNVLKGRLSDSDTLVKVWMMTSPIIPKSKLYR